MKNLSKLACLLTILIAFNIDTFGQQFGVKVSGGISRIDGQMDTDYYPEPPMSTSFSPSLQAGIYYQLPIGKKTSFGAELLYSKVQGAQTLKWDESHYNGLISHTIYEHVSYLSLPIYVGLTFNRLTLDAGFQISHALSSSAENKIMLVHNGVEKEMADPPASNFHVNNFDFGPRAGIVYQLNNRLSLEGMFYYGLHNINYPKSSNTDLKVQQMTVGLRYALKDKQTNNLASFAHQQWGIKASGGISRIYGQLESRNYPLPTVTTSFSPSFQAGIFYNYSLGKRSFIGSELLFSQVAGGQTYIWDQNIHSMNADVRYYGSHILNERISWLSLPLYYGVTFKRLTFNAGFQVSYALSSSGNSKFDYVQEIITPENEDPLKRLGGTHREYNELAIKAFDFGPRIGGIIRLTSRLSMEGVFYYGISNINQLKSTKEALKIQQMTVGIRYALWSKNDFK